MQKTDFKVYSHSRIFSLRPYGIHIKEGGATSYDILFNTPFRLIRLIVKDYYRYGGVFEKYAKNRF